MPKTCALLEEVEEKMLWKGPAFAVLGRVPGLKMHEMRTCTMLLAQTLGRVLVQNAEGDKSVLVFDRDATRTMDKGARYHQVRIPCSFSTVSRSQWGFNGFSVP